MFKIAVCMIVRKEVSRVDSIKSESTSGIETR